MFKESKVTRLSIPGWQAVFRTEIRPGILSFIAVHDTTRGSALGGCRMVKYASESQALTDVLRLSRGMTFKNTIAGLPLGGGKEVEKFSREKTLKKIKRTVRKMLGTTFRTAFRKKIPFNAAVDHVVDQIVWGNLIDGLNFLNRKIFPLTYTTEFSD